MDERRAQAHLHASVSVFLAVVGVAFAVRPGGPARCPYGLVALGVLFFG